MSNEIFPRLPGLTWDVKPVPTWSTVVQKSKNRARTAVMNDPQPLYTFELSFEFLRDSPPPRPGDPCNPRNDTELDQIVGFYNRHGGRFDSFLLDPGQLTQRPDKWAVSGAQIGVGDGTTTAFQLQHARGGFNEWVENPAGTPVICDNSVPLTSGWSLGTAGVINFATAPASGHIITADFHWRYRVAFAEDSLGDLSAFMFNLYELQSLKLEQVPL